MWLLNCCVNSIQQCLETRETFPEFELEELYSISLPGKHSIIATGSLITFTTLVYWWKSTLVFLFCRKSFKTAVMPFNTFIRSLLSVLALLQIFFTQYLKGRTGRSQAKDRKYIPSLAQPRSTSFLKLCLGWISSLTV